MSDLNTHLEDYLEMRRRLGFAGGKDPFTLRSFVRFAQQTGVDTITTAAVVEWVNAPAGADRSWLARRFSVVRSFARHVHAIDPVHEVPPAKMFTAPQRRRVPHIYTSGEICGLMDAAGTLGGQLRPATYATLIGLLAVTGMRISEALALDDTDVDLDAGIITIVGSKFNKSRQLPLHPSTVDALHRYMADRDRHTRTDASALFVNDNTNRVRYRQCQSTFVACLRVAGLDDTSRRRPRMHDLRHTFAVKTLIGWYANDTDVGAMMPYLSTYLGHVDPASTYWYLSAVPELAAVIAGRLDHTDGVTP